MTTKDTRPRILVCAFEAMPFVKTGGLGDVAGSLPKALNAHGANARLIMPKLGGIAQDYKDRMRHVTDFTVDLGWRKQYCGLESLRVGGVTCYFIDNEYYFGRDKAYGYYDDCERVAFFSKAVLAVLPHLKNFFPQVLHLNDWHTALVPVYLKTLFAADGRYDGLKTVFTIHNLRFQGQYDPYIIGNVLGLEYDAALNHGLVRGRSLNLMQGALVCADRVTTVSPTYAKEICTSEYGEGIDDVLRTRGETLLGLLNGIDVRQWDPRKDKAITPYDIEHMDGKAKNKAALQAKLGLVQDPDAPLAVLVSRLTDQKGLDLLLQAAPGILDAGVQLAILGTGDRFYEEAFSRMAAERPGQVAACIQFDETFSHLMYAGGDMVLVPSQFEPCGLTQMYGLRYGTLPVVRETGGLKDSVEPYNQYTGEGTGFSFKNYSAHELYETIVRAAEIYRNDRAGWDALVRNAMSRDFSWNSSAANYMEMFNALIEPVAPAASAV